MCRLLQQACAQSLAVFKPTLAIALRLACPAAQGQHIMQPARQHHLLLRLDTQQLQAPLLWTQHL